VHGDRRVERADDSLTLRGRWAALARVVAIIAGLLIGWYGGLAIGRALADDTPVTTGPLAKKARKPAAAKVVKVPDPTPVCRWTPVDPSPCECWYKTASGEWEWNACPPPVERLAFDEIPVPEPEPEAPPVLPPTPAPSEPGLRLGLQAWSLAGFSGAADERVTYGGRISADGPVAHAWRAPVRMFAVLDLSALPGQALNLTSVESFGRSAEFRGGLYVRLAESWPAAQHITTSIVGWGGFATMMDGEFLDRYLRSGGIGLRLAEEVGGAELVLAWCRDEAAGYIGAGQVCVSGSVPIAGTKGAMVLGGNAVLNLSRASVTPQRDRFVVFAGVSVGDVVSAVRERQR
jgi:hypothetical protein